MKKSFIVATKQNHVILGLSFFTETIALVLPNFFNRFLVLNF